MSKYNLYLEDVSVEAVFNKLGGVGGAKRFLADELVLVEAQPKPEPPPEPVLDFLVRVDRTVHLTYPGWMKEKDGVMHPELELAGPAEYNLRTCVQEWLHDQQKGRTVKGQLIYDHLKASNELVNQLGLADLLAIQAKSIAVFRKLYAGKAVFGWKSVVQDRDGGLFVPCLYEHGDKVVVSWYWLGGHWNSDDPALRFSK